MIHFILGGARSGKSSFAEKFSLEYANKKRKGLSYIATASAIDHEMNNRIVKHQADRSEQWCLIECPLALANQINNTQSSDVYLVDCLTLWLNNILYQGHDKLTYEEQENQLKHEMSDLINALKACQHDVVIVSNEVGLGIIPMGEITRLYVDYCGWLNQQVASLADRVTLVTAGLPLILKNGEYD